MDAETSKYLRRFVRTFNNIDKLPAIYCWTENNQLQVSWRSKEGLMRSIQVTFGCAEKLANFLNDDLLDHYNFKPKWKVLIEHGLPVLVNIYLRNDNRLYWTSNWRDTNIKPPEHPIKLIFKK